MNLKMLSNAELVIETKRAVGEERQAMLVVLDYLREVYRRSLHLQMSYSSLHEFCVAELKYSDGAAGRRVSAMWLCEEVPTARQALTTGALSLSTAAILSNFFHKDENSGVTDEEKQVLLARVQGKSKTECDRILYPDQTGTVVRFTADDETMALLKRLSELTAIRASDPAALIKRIAKIALGAIDPLAGKKPRKTAPPAELAKTAKAAPPAELAAKPGPLSSRYVDVATKRQVWIRDNGQCTYVDPLSRRRCSSRFGLQLDHIIPLACGGPTTMSNLRLLCAGHNRLAAQRVYGKKKMARYARLHL